MNTYYLISTYSFLTDILCTFKKQMQKKTHTQSSVYINHETRRSNDILHLAQNNNTRSFKNNK